MSKKLNALKARLRNVAEYRENASVVIAGELVALIGEMEAASAWRTGHPSMHGWFLVTTGSGYVDAAFWKAESSEWIRPARGHDRSMVVLAWKPLPEPWRAP